MRYLLSPLALVLIASCQPAPPAQPPASAGSTTYTRGALTVTRSDTTRTRQEPGAGEAGGVSLGLDRTTYAAGATVTMRINNQTADTLGYNQCSSRSVELQSGSTWVMHPEPNRACTMELRLLEPRETQTAATDLPESLRAGTYRIVLTLGRQSTADVTPGI